MRTTAIALALIFASVTVMEAQAADAGWVYPGGRRADPFGPPAILTAGAAMPRLRVTTILHFADHPIRSTAVVHLEGARPLRRVVRAGDRVGDYRVERVEPNGVWVRVPVLGSLRRIFVSPEPTAARGHLSPSPAGELR